jgi:ferrochelatase
MAHPSDPSPYDALLLVSFGGPERPEDVVPFLQNVTTGRGIPPERLAEVGEHYYAFGGRSPINDQCRELLRVIGDDLRAADLDLPVYWGNRNWDPYLRDTVAQMATDGIKRAACFVTSAYSSYSGCRQYRENLFDAVSGVPNAPRLDRLRHYFNHPGFLQPFVDSTLAALAELPPDAATGARLVFVTHSIPLTMAESSGRSAAAGTSGGAYVRQHLDAMAQVSAGVEAATGISRAADLVYCSRSGSPQVPWLEPDINDHLAALAEQGAPAVVVVPIGFVSDHMEVAFDLDTEAAATAGSLGLPYARASTPGADLRFAGVVRDLLLERAAVERGQAIERLVVGAEPASWDRCPPGCCYNARQPGRPAIGGEDGPADGSADASEVLP